MDTPQLPSSQIVTFLEGQTFFITGVTGKPIPNLKCQQNVGFLGKVVLYKLLSSCPNLKDKSVYVLVRGKKELSAESRFEKDILESSLLFSPQTVVGKRARTKIKVWAALLSDLLVNMDQVIDGDIAKSKLGMSPADYEEVASKCTTLLHMVIPFSFNSSNQIGCHYEF